ncbi:hypothetical protein GQ44DRAFT_622639 [Phaeosphaeriaceae sp. PMI808]|nr:hypothetical protein GQ44DRAFT_622639 [Phaeosphaeriaceae sp. PMI808]
MAPHLSNYIRKITLHIRGSSLPEAPTAAGSSAAAPNDGFTPSAVIGIVTAVVGLLVLVPLIVVIIRRYERKRCHEMLPDSASLGSSKRSVEEHQSLKSILVTKEVQRSSVRVSAGVTKPPEAHTHEREWSQTSVRGGHW